MNIYEGYERLLGCILARNADEFYKAYGGNASPNGMSNSDRAFWRYVSGQVPLNYKSNHYRSRKNDKV